jgi:glucose-6-phosphate 1-dehydrogenase
LSYCYRPGQIPDPYTQVLSKAFAGEKELFVTMDEVLTSWKLSQSFSELAHENLQQAGQLEIYEPGTTGPEAAAQIPQKYATNWIEENYFKFCRM